MFLTFLFGSFHSLRCVCCSALSCFLFPSSSTTGLFPEHQSKQLWCRQFIYFSEFWSSLSKQCLFTKPYGICNCFDMRIPQHACVFFSIYGWYKLLQWTVCIDLYTYYKVGVWCEHTVHIAQLICQDSTCIRINMYLVNKSLCNWRCRPNYAK